MSAEIASLPIGVKGPDRIRQLMRTEGLRQKDIAHAIGISESQLSYMLNEERAITSDIARQLSNRFGGEVGDYAWDLGRKAIPDGLITGDALWRLCTQRGILKKFDPSNIATSHVYLRVAHQVAVSTFGENKPPKELDLVDSPLLLHAGQVVHLTVAEELLLPGDIQANMYVVPEKVPEGIPPISLMFPPLSPSFPPIRFQFWGEQPFELREDQALFMLTLTKV